MKKNTVIIGGCSKTSVFGTAIYENRSFATRRAENCNSLFRNNRFWNRLIGLIFLICLLFSGCDLFEKYATFKNESSHSVSVTPDGEGTFTLNIGASKTVGYSGTSIQFLYSPANLVKTKLDGDTITFVDQ
jgi:hypothetical protein